MKKEKLRRSLLYVSASKPGGHSQSPFYGSDCIIYDLEDSVSITEKDAARFLIFNTLKKKRPENIEIIVRVNAMDTPFAAQDLEAIVRAKPDVIRFPKIETPEDVKNADDYISKVEIEAGIEVGSTRIIAGMETHTGVLNAREIAKSSQRIIAISIGGEDFTASMKTTRSVEGLEMFYARNTILLAARAAGVQALDTIFSDINNEEGLIEDTMLIKKLGFDGKYLIHPRQVEPVNNVFTPNDKEIQNAIRILNALKEANKRNLGVVALDGKMIDAPVVERAKRVIALAEASGIIVGGEL